MRWWIRTSEQMPPTANHADSSAGGNGSDGFSIVITSLPVRPNGVKCFALLLLLAPGLYQRPADIYEARQPILRTSPNTFPILHCRLWRRNQLESAIATFQKYPIGRYALRRPVCRG